jgi:hypothetical protein
MKVDKKLLKDTMGRPLTQGLFLEIGYNTEYAVYTLDDEDKTYKDKLYPSLKKLYLACEDPTEYKFSKIYLLNWQHWKRLNANKVLKEYFDEWREELEIMLRSEAVATILEMTTENNFQAAKWLADRGWEKRGAGRPLKADLEREARIKDRISDALMEDVDRMEKFDA